jgi:drug/metabolite transporter (DMT)-like permease
LCAPVLASFLTTVLWAFSAVCGTRSARILGGTEANFWRLVCATVMLGLWAHLFGQGLGGAAFPMFFLSGVIGIGGDIFLFQSYPRIGSRLTILIIQCGAALSGAAIEWLWQGTRLSAGQMGACATILAGVALALAPGKHLNATRRAVTLGVGFSVLAALANGIAAVLSRKANAVAAAAGESTDPATAAYQRLVGGLIVAAVCVVAVRWRRRRPQTAPVPADAGLTGEKWRAAWPWVLANAMAGQTFGVVCYQWALKTTPAGLVLAVISTSPVVVIPFSQVVEGEKMSRRSILGGVIAVIGAVILATSNR